jgi:hypothetical protein
VLLERAMSIALPATTTPMPQSNTSTSIGITHGYLNMTKGVSTGNVATTSVHSTSSQNFSTRKQINIVTASPVSLYQMFLDVLLKQVLSDVWLLHVLSDV